MSSYKRYKQSTLNSTLVNEIETDYKDSSEQVSDYMKCADTRFTEICDIYLKCLKINDIKFMDPEDLIRLVPPEQYNHRLLMTILVKKYLFRDDDICDDICDDMYNDDICRNKNADHKHNKSRHKKHHK